MTTTSQDLLYAKSHEWIRIEGDQVTIGISDFAQNELGDVVFVDLPEVGRTLKPEEAFGSVESVKAASDVYAPVGGEVTEINQALLDEPELINSDSYGDGWMIKLRASDLDAQKSGLLDAEAYMKYTAEESH